jgi:hypothetical protein
VYFLAILDFGVGCRMAAAASCASTNKTDTKLLSWLQFLYDSTALLHFGGEIGSGKILPPQLAKRFVSELLKVLRRIGPEKVFAPSATFQGNKVSAATWLIGRH